MADQTETPSDLLSIKRGIDDRIAIANLSGLEAIQAAFAVDAVSALPAALEALLPQLAPDDVIGTPYNQARCAISTIRGVSDFFDREVSRVQALATAQSQVPAP